LFPLLPWRAILAQLNAKLDGSKEQAMRDGSHREPVEFDRLLAPSSAYAPRKIASYLCDREHLVAVPFAADAEIPESWECRCGQPATLVAGSEPAAPAS
jgi:hypothetical protein